jgi:hypothetical protein
MTDPDAGNLLDPAPPRVSGVPRAFGRDPGQSQRLRLKPRYIAPQISAIRVITIG